MYWNHFIREMCEMYFQNNPIQLGGPGICTIAVTLKLDLHTEHFHFVEKEVQIDESKFGKRKYNRTCQTWTVGFWHDREDQMKL